MERRINEASRVKTNDLRETGRKEERHRNFSFFLSRDCSSDRGGSIVRQTALAFIIQIYRLDRPPRARFNDVA